MAAASPQHRVEQPTDTSTASTNDEPDLAAAASTSQGGHGGQHALPAVLLQDVLTHVVAILSPDKADVRAFRLTCRAWRAAADLAAHDLLLRAPRILQAINQFPSLTSLDLTECSHVRNTHLEALACGDSGARLKTLKLGNVNVPHAGKIKLSNQAMVWLGQLTSLRCVSLCNCWAITDQGMAALSALTAISSLTVLDCPRVTDRGLTFITQLHSLEDLALSGAKVTDVTLLQLPALITLTRLHLCCVGASSPTLATILLAFPRLTTLILAWMPLTAAVTSTLRSMTQLNALQLLECRGVHGGDMLEAAAQLCGLTKLHVHSVEGAMGGEMEHGVATVAQHLPRLADFSCIGVYGPSMQPLLGRLASLQGLERLRLGAPTGRWASQLTALSALTALTALQVKCCHFSYTGSWASVLSRLPLLASLDLSHNWTGHPTSHIFPPSWCLVTNGLVRAIIACTHIVSLDLSFTHANSEQLCTLVHGLPRLRELSMYGTPVAATTLRALEAAAPRLHVRAHRGGAAEEVPTGGRPTRAHRRGGRRRPDMGPVVALRHKGAAVVMEEGVVTS